MGEYEDRYPEAYNRGESEAPQDAAFAPTARAERFSLRSWFGGGAATAPSASGGHGPAASDVRMAQPGWRHEPRQAAALRHAISPAMPAGEGRFRGVGPRGYVRSAQRIHEDLCDRLTDDPLIDPSDVDIIVSGGEVSLTGSVDDATMASRIEAMARGVPGVKSIRNNLQLRHAPATQTAAAPVGRPHLIDAG